MKTYFGIPKTWMRKRKLDRVKHHTEFQYDSVYDLLASEQFYWKCVVCNRPYEHFNCGILGSCWIIPNSDKLYLICSVDCGRLLQVIPIVEFPANE